jgi:hypothetical protein
MSAELKHTGEPVTDKAHNAKVAKMSREIAAKIEDAIKPQRSKAEKTMALGECQAMITKLTELAKRVRQAGSPMALAKDLQEALHEWLLEYQVESLIFSTNFPTVFEFEDPHEQRIYVRMYRQEEAYKTRDLQALETLRNEQLAELKGCMATLLAALDGIAEYTNKAVAYQQLVAEIEAPARGVDPMPKTAAKPPAKIVKKVAKVEAAKIVKPKVEDKSKETEWVDPPFVETVWKRSEPLWVPRDDPSSESAKAPKPPAKIVKKVAKVEVKKKVAKVDKKAAKIVRAKMEDKSEESDILSDVAEPVADPSSESE